MIAPAFDAATDVTVLAEDADMLEEALQLAEAGFRVIPLHSPDPNHASRCSCQRSGCESAAKHPRTKHGVKDASNDAEEVHRWWRMWPDANIGIATGSGLVVLDEDPRNDGDSSLQDLEDEHGEIVTLTAYTGGGGTHLYLQGDLPQRAGFRPGLDLKADGGYVVAPPSKHASGRRYTWVDRGEGIRDVPVWLAGIVEKSKPATGPPGTLPDTIPAGERNNTLASMAGKMRRSGFSEEEILSALETANAKRCAEPLPDDEVRGIAASVARYDPTPVAKQCAGPSGGVTFDDFYAYMPEHKYIFIPARELWPVSSVNARLPSVAVGDKKIKAGVWLDQHQAVEQMTWAPGEELLIKDRLVSNGGWIKRPGCSCFNLYRPPSVSRGVPGSATPWLDLIERVFPDDAAHIVRYFAHRVQKPSVKPNHAIVLGGPQGVGKDSILEPVKHAVGPWNFHEVAPAQITGRFNNFVKSVILRVSEARDLGDVDRYGFYEHMKQYTAAPPDVLRCDEKNVREYSVFNVCGVVLTTNHKNAGIYLPADDRRHYVAWSEVTKDDFTPDYWTKLWTWYEREGHGHVAAYLADLDISDFDAKAPPPKTSAFWEIVDSNRAPEDAELADVLEKLGHPTAITLAMIANRADTSFGDWLRDRKNRRLIPHRLEAADYVSVRNDAAKDGLWKISGKRQAIYAHRDSSRRDRITAAQNFAKGPS